MPSNAAAADTMVAQVKKLFGLTADGPVDPMVIAARIPGFKLCECDAPEDATDFSRFVVRVPSTYSPAAERRLLARATVRFLAARWSHDPHDETFVSRVGLQLFGERSLGVVRAS